MARRKKEIPQMAPNIDLEEWEAMVEDKKAALLYDEEFLKLCEFFIVADAAADVVDDQFSRRLTEQDRRIINNLLHWLAFVGYVIQAPGDYLKGDEEDFILESYWEDKTTPKPLAEALLRLAYFVANSKLDMNNPDIFGY